MPLSEFRDTYSWQEAVALGPSLVQLSEQLPAAEEMGLNFTLRQAMIELPASVAYDLLEGGSYSRRLQIARVVAILDIIDQVYPALDTGDVRRKLEKLTDRVAGDRFGEQTPGAAKAHLPGATAHAVPADPPPARRVIEPPPAEPVLSEPMPVDVQPDVAPPAPAATKVQITPEPSTQPDLRTHPEVSEPEPAPAPAEPQEDSQDRHVQPNSIQ